MKQNRRIRAALLGAVVLFALFFSVLFLAVEAHHDCAGPGCPVCRQLQICARMLEALGTAVALALPAAFLRFAAAAKPADWPRADRPVPTLVSLKVKLSD